MIKLEQGKIKYPNQKQQIKLLFIINPECKEYTRGQIIWVVEIPKIQRKKLKL